MADLSCSFLDFRSLTNNSNLHLFLQSKRYSSYSVRPYSSRINGMKRRPLHLALHSKPSSAASSSQDLDVISTHKHSDGSLLFRFGNPSEVAKNVKLEESKTIKDETEGEGEDGYGALKVSESDHEREGTIQKADKELTGSGLTEMADQTNSMPSSSKSISVDEGENGSSDKLLERSNDAELPVSVSSEEMEVNFTPSVDIDHTGNVDEDLNEEHKDSSLAFASIPDESVEMENNTYTVEEKETADVLQASLETSVTADDSADSEHENVETEMQNETIEGGKEIVKNELVSPSPQSGPTINLSEGIEDQNLQAGMQSLITEEESEIDMNDHVDLQMQHGIVDNGNGNGNGNGSDMNEAEAKLPPKEADVSMVAEAQSSANGTEALNEIVDYESESDTVQLMTVSSQLEAQTVLDEETGTDNVDESREDNGAESLKVLNNIPQTSILGSETTEADDNVKTRDLVEASIHEVTELKSTESATKSQEILMTNFVLSSGAALLPHPSKALTGGEDAYFVAGQTWLGVADGVEQWSLEETKPGVFAQELMKNCERLISNCNGNPVNNPVELLRLSVAETQSPGSATALIAQFGDQALHVANIGDSGFIVLRHGAVYKRSSPMLHLFGFPLQIERGHDPSSVAEFYRVDLEEGDVIIIATDGLLDNLYDQEISSIVMKSLAADKKPKEIAELLATKAQEIGRCASAISPFAVDAQAAGYAGYTGGKLDGVAVIVSLVQKQSNPQTL